MNRYRWRWQSAVLICGGAVALFSCERRVPTSPSEVPAPSADQARGPLNECLINSGTFNATFCQVTGTITPFYGGSFWWVGSWEWTSAPVTNGVLPPTTLMVINFSKPLYMVQVVAMDADVGPPTMVAFDSLGHQIASASFDYGPTSPHHGTSGRTIVDTLVRIRRVELRPATNAPDVIFWRDLTIDVPTPPPPISEKLTITPASVWLKAGQTATFKVTTDVRNPPVIKEWFWQEDESSPPSRGARITSVDNCGTNPTCTFPLFESGWLWAIGQNGTAIDGKLIISGSAYAFAGVLPCPSDTVSDPMVHNPSFRMQMQKLAAAMTHYEEGETPIIRIADSTIDVITYPNRYIGRTDTVPCNHYLPDFAHPSKQLPPDFVPTSMLVHTHPVVKNDAMPPECVGGLKNQVATVVVDGPSPGDYDTFKASGFVGYIAAKDGYVYRFNYPGDTPHHSKRWKFDSDANGSSSCLLPDTHWKG